MKIGFLFPGQGSQSLNMGKDLYDTYEEVRYIYEKVKQISGIDVAKITFEGTEEELNHTKNTQVCILAMSLAILEILKKKNISADISSGLSLGEYTSLIYSGALDFEEGVDIVRKRGEYMQKLTPKGNWKMAAIIGLEEEKVQEAVEKVKDGFVRPVNFNCPGQIVISGEQEAVEKVEQIVKNMGAKKVIPLKTTGPFHTEKLIDASNALRVELEKIKIHDFKTVVVKNLDGMPYKKEDDVKEILVKHIINPVRFQDCIETMIKMNVDTFIEVGSGKSLAGFAKRMKGEKNIDILNINSVESLENTIKFIKERKD